MIESGYGIALLWERSAVAGLAVTMLGLAGVSTSASAAWADNFGPSPRTSMYRALVPEISASLPDPADLVTAYRVAVAMTREFSDSPLYSREL